MARCCKPSYDSLNLLKVFGGGSSFVNENSLQLNGTTQAVNIDSVMPVFSSINAVSTWHRFADTTPTNPTGAGLWCFGDTNAAEFISAVLAASGQLQVTARNAAELKWQFNSTSSIGTIGIQNNEWFNLQVTYDSDNDQPLIRLNGDVVAGTFTISTDTTFWFSDLTNVDNGRIGCRNFNSAGNTQFAAMVTDDFRCYSTILTANQSKSIYNGGRPTTNNVAGLLVHYTFGDNANDNWNVDNANQWTFYNSASGDYRAVTIAGTLGMVISDAPDAPNKPLVVIDGNSLPAQSINNLRAEFVLQYGAIGPSYDYVNIAVGGQTFEDMIADAYYDFVLRGQHRATKYAILHEIRNQCINSTASQTFAFLTQLADLLKANGWTVVVIQTSAARFPEGGGGAIQTRIPETNDLIADDVTGRFDLKINLYDYTTPDGNFNDPDDTDLFVDTVHYTNPLGRNYYSNFVATRMKAEYTTL